MSEKIDTKECPICKHVDYGLFQDKEDILCIQCRRQFSLANHPHVLYLYNDFLRAMLFQYKAMGDLVLAPLFLMDYQKKLKRRYRGYVIVLAPSLQEDNFKRGFASLPWMFRSLGLPMISPFQKTSHYKQATSKHRENIKEVIAFKENVYLKGKKLLLVDDVMTSGYTIKTCIQLLETQQPKTIDYLVVAAKKENIRNCIKNIEEGRILHERKSTKIL